jgi:hypothetical protein
MWQCTSSGNVNGISGDVDLNFWYGEIRDRTYNSRNQVIKTPTTNPQLTATAVVTAPAKASISKLAKGKKSAKISIKKVKGAKGYKIEYSTKKSFKAKYTKQKITTKTTLTIKKLKSNKTYYFRIKAYKSDGNKKIYSKNWSKIKKVKVK